MFIFLSINSAIRCLKFRNPLIAITVWIIYPSKIKTLLGEGAMKSKQHNRGMKRRNFLKVTGAGLLSLPFATRAKPAFASSADWWNQSYWQGAEGSEYCVHRTVYDGEVDQGYIWARIDGWWRRFKIGDLEETYWDWNFGERIESFEQQLDPETPYEFRAGGPHSPSVATYGNVTGRGDSSFHVNNKIIGMNCIPKNEYIKDINDTMLEMIEAGADQNTKVSYLLELHQQRDMWRKDVQLGIELFSDATWQTHTFLNLMENPAATLCFQGRHGMNIFNSYEVRCIAHIVHPKDPDISEEMYQVAIFPSVLHGFFHSFYPDNINEPAVVYYTVEEFDNSVMAKGERLVKKFRNGIKNYFV